MNDDESRLEMIQAMIRSYDRMPPPVGNRTVVPPNEGTFAQLNDAIQSSQARFGTSTVFPKSLGKIGSVHIPDAPRESIVYDDYTFLGGGSDAVAVLRSEDGKHVLKFYRTDRIEDTVRRIVLHNHLFGTHTGYTPLGFSVATASSLDPNEVYLVLKKPFIIFEPNSGAKARRELVREMKQRFGRVQHFYLHSNANSENNDSNRDFDGDFIIGNNQYTIDDLKDGNIGIDETTDTYAVVDCIIHQGVPHNSVTDLEDL